MGDGNTASSFWNWAKKEKAKVLPLLRDAAFASQHERVYHNAYSYFFAPRTADTLPFFEGALADKREDVQSLASRRLVNVSRVEFAPLFLTLLKKDNQGHQLVAIEGLKRFALPEAIEPLAELLNDPDIEIRETALDALKSIRETLKEKEEWQKVLESLRGREPR